MLGNLSIPVAEITDDSNPEKLTGFFFFFDTS